MKGVKGMEKFVLGGVFTGNKLNIVHQEQVCFPVLGAECQVITGFNSGNQLVDELVTLNVNDPGIGIVLSYLVGDGIQQMGFAHTGRAV